MAEAEAEAEALSMLHMPLLSLAPPRHILSQGLPLAVRELLLMIVAAPLVLLAAIQLSQLVAAHQRSRHMAAAAALVQQAQVQSVLVAVGLVLLALAGQLQALQSAPQV